MGMNALMLAVLIAFWGRFPDAEAPLRAWYKRIRSHTYANFAEVKADFGSADWVKGFIVFDIAGNRYRLIVEPNFQGQRFYIEAVLTHSEYDDWRA